MLNLAVTLHGVLCSATRALGSLALALLLPQPKG